jgi:hypothetical protein
MYISVGTVLVVLLCIWFGYVFMPEVDRISKEREWSRPERESLKQRKKEAKQREKENRVKWWQYPTKEKIEPTKPPDRVAELDKKARQGQPITPAELDEYRKLIAERRRVREEMDAMFG